MRLAIIADIHGNCLALEAVLAGLRPDAVDQIVCLGDAIQGGPQPAETVARLRELGCPVVMGNADAWLLTGQETGQEPVSDRQRAVREWSLAQLSSTDHQFMESFRPTVEITLGGGRSLLCFHGSPHSFDDVILPETPEEEFQQRLGGFGSAVLTGGHTHMQQIRRVGDSFFFNPGSIGLAYRHHQPPESFQADPWAEYAILSLVDERLRLEFRRVPFDANALIRLYLSSGRPYADAAAADYNPAIPKI